MLFWRSRLSVSSKQGDVTLYQPPFWRLDAVEMVRLQSQAADQDRRQMTANLEIIN